MLENEVDRLPTAHAASSKSKYTIHQPRFQANIPSNRWYIAILRDPVSRVGRKGGTKVFKYVWKGPWVPTLTELFPKIKRMLAPYWAQKCFVLLRPIGEQFLLSSFREFVHDGSIVSITACLAHDHAPKKCTQSGNIQFDIISPSDFEIRSAQKLKTLFHKYKLELTTGIHVCIGHVLRKY